ncbi:MAG: ABC transporter permease [Bifidobacteriaceae bacterium]|jgi:ABC-2 type transport system permease protein|nr:ABC transporter permease [Bifidobacteriaceae bacterium]
MSRVWLVTKREILTQARTKSFIISTSLMIAAVFLGALAPGLLSGLGADSEKDVKVAAVGALAEVLEALEGFDVLAVDSPADAEQAVRDERVDAAVTPAEDAATPLGLEVIARDESPARLLAALTVSPAVRLLDPPKVGEFFQAMAAMVIAILFFMIVMMYGQLAAQNTVVEKQTRVIELLLATVPARVLLAGKIASNAVLAFATVAAMSLALVLGLALGGTWDVLAGGDLGLADLVGDNLARVLGGSLGWFLAFFAVAFVMFSSLMVGCAAMVSRLEEVGSVLVPVTMLIMVPYFLVVAFGSNAEVMAWLSYIPFSSPTAMTLRLITGEAAWWQPVVALAILAATTWLAIILAGKLYENSILRTGARVKFLSALRDRP